MPSDIDILRLRLRRQLIERSAGGGPAADPAAVVRRLCAMQAQDHAGALRAVGLRYGPDATAAEVERAIAERRIVRTWPMRGTLHLVAPEDVRWMLALLAPRQIARAATRHAQLGLTEDRGSDEAAERYGRFLGLPALVPRLTGIRDAPRAESDA